MPDGLPISVSIALITRNRPESLERCLESWRSQTTAPYEIVVSDDSDERFAGDTKNIAARYGCIYTEGPRRGMYANRNHVSLTCTGTHILTDDDDHTHPQDYVERVVAEIERDPRRIWIFPERDNPSEPDSALQCPPELHRSGNGCTPRDPSDCAAIADGSSVYPREVFDGGLRYDETFPYGGLWYLWGKLLKRHGWRISFSDATYVWHWNVHGDRFEDYDSLRVQFECMTYILFANSLWVDRSIVALFWACAYTAKRILIPDSLYGYNIRTRLSPRSALKALSLAMSYPQRRRSFGIS